jgi:hypothetical protein
MVCYWREDLLLEVCHTYNIIGIRKKIFERLKAVECYWANKWIRHHCRLYVLKWKLEVNRIEKVFVAQSRLCEAPILLIVWLDHVRVDVHGCREVVADPVRWVIIGLW